MSDQIRGTEARVEAWLSLGANLGNPIRSVMSAVDLIAGIPETRMLACSSLYRTAPVGHRDQPPFVNAVVSIETSLAPYPLLDELHAIESSLGRKDRPRWHEREIDIDILMFGGVKLKSDELSIPHGRMHERAFVLVPLNELAPDLVHPVSGRSVRSLLEGLPADEESWVELIGTEEIEWAAQ